MRLLYLATIAAGLVAQCVNAGEARFAQPPRVERMGDRAAVSFEVNEPTDVEITVVNARGETVRHLAAGVLGGKNLPPPPLTPGLAQKIAWDGQDDFQRPAAGGPFRFCVRLGLSVRFGKIIGGSPTTGGVVTMPYRAPVNGLAVDAAGNLYVKLMSSVGSHGNSGMWPWHIRKLDRAGDYVATLLPYPPSTRPQHATGMTLLDTPGRFTPANRNSLYPVLTVLGNELVSRVVDDQLVFIHTEARAINFFSLDGTNRVRTLPMWPAAPKLNCPTWLDIQVAFSPDGRYAYYSNVAGTAYDGKRPDDIDARWPQGRVYRHDLLQPDSEPTPFFDLKLPDWEREPYWMPSAWDKKTAAAGIDVDADGSVLLCDLVNQQLVEISSTGRLLGATDVPWPDKIMVSRKTDNVYVISRKVSRGALPRAALFKLGGATGARKVVAELPLAGSVGGAYTLDESQAVPVLWLAGGESHEGSRGTDKLLRIEDHGDRFVVTRDDCLNGDERAITFVGYLDVDRAAELVYVTGSGDKVWRFHGETGEGGPLELKAVDVAIGPGGAVYTWGTGSYQGPLARYTRDLAPAPLEATGKHLFGYVYGRGGRGLSVCGLDVDWRGRVYATFGSNDCHVRVYEPDGNLVEFPGRVAATKEENGQQEVSAAITGVTGYGGSVRVDQAGNIYLLQHGVSEEHAPPAGFEKDEAYRMTVGTIYKFPPGGGAVHTKSGTVSSVDGAVATYAGCGPISRWRAVGACACTKPRFDVDDFGRLYIPSGITYSVSIRDNSDNEIIRFGAYGNFDCQGPASRESSPEIPLGWPIVVGASDRYVYVGDCLNHRIVRADKHFAAQAFAAINER